MEEQRVEQGKGTKSAGLGVRGEKGWQFRQNGQGSLIKKVTM